MADLIDRQAALAKSFDIGAFSNVVSAYDIAMIPAIDPESLHPKGKWETYPSHAYRKCSVCKMEFDKPKFNIRTNFCPNCGADMR